MKTLADYLFYHEPGPPDIKIFKGNCLELMPMLSEQVSLILTDPPYNSTECDWDTVFKIDDFFWEVKKLLTENGSMVVTVAFPFGLLFSKDHLNFFKYDMVWCKSNKTDFTNAKNKPLRQHENILVFSKGTTANGSDRRMTYNPQGIQKLSITNRRNGTGRGKIGIREDYADKNKNYNQENTNYPTTLKYFDKHTVTEHETEKPISLFKDLVLTYSNPQDFVCDPFLGSGTSAVACKELKRNFIGIELNPLYAEITKKRLQNTQVPFL